MRCPPPVVLNRRTLLFAATFLASTLAAQAQSTYTIQRVFRNNTESGGTITKAPSADFATIQIALADSTVQQNLTAGDTFLVKESLGTLTGALITEYPGDFDYPTTDIQVIADITAPGQCLEVAFIGSGVRSVIGFTSHLNTRASLLEGVIVTGGGGSHDGYLTDPTALVGGGISCLGATPTIRSCTVKDNGLAVDTGDMPVTLGGGIYASRGSSEGDHLSGPLIDSCIVEGNLTSLSGTVFDPTGAGIYAYQCSPEVVDTTVRYNTSHDAGGGVAFENSYFGSEEHLSTQPMAEGCEVHDNTAYNQGGGVYVKVLVNPLFEQCRIRSNVAGGQGQSSGEGGGMYWDNSTVELVTSVISNNRADTLGGGLLIEGEGDIPFAEGNALGGTPGSRLTHCTIQLNETTDSGFFVFGGGVHARQGADPSAQTVTQFENCLIVNNKANDRGGMSIVDTSVSLQNCTVSQNTAKGIGSYGGVSFANNTGITGINLTINDSIVTGNRYRVTAPTNAWEADLVDLNNAAGFDILLTYSIMNNASTWQAFTSSGTNKHARPYFTSGASWTYFPANGFYLSHQPHQAVTSIGYNNGSQPISSLLVVDGMTCRTALINVDVGQVDIGFHYPSSLTGLP